ncbi:hypothetical protein ARMA_0095 [Ardenticatena maritima]|uniref:CRISPR-associated protein Cas6 C-terminal domain-containing protein n=3 Tax=Ardenticatena maritima TaxID=872965 RepID=A0A0M8K6E7_9CHLR|nr:hypothetical protein ARMA_0095 [Ardenticatena maritima]
MHNLKACILEFTVAAKTPLELPHWAGSALRGALLGVLRRHYCPVPEGGDTAHTATCPACWLIARENPQWWRGRQPVRPYTVAVSGGQGRPIDHVLNGGPGWYRLEPGDTFTFRMTLFGVAVNLLPYLVLAIPAMGQIGIGRRMAELRGKRGQFTLRRIEALNPLTGQRELIMKSPNHEVTVPTLFIDQSTIDAATHRLLDSMTQNEITVQFRSPTRLVEQGHLLKVPHFRPIFQRLLERVEGVIDQYADGEPEWNYASLIEAATQVRMVRNQTHWVEVKSGSRRTGRVTPLSGFVGQATYTAKDWRPLLPILLWGCVVQIGRSTVKGNGWISIHAA